MDIKKYKWLGSLALIILATGIVMLYLARCGISDSASGISDINTVLSMVAGRRMRISGDIVDDKGQPLSGVMVKIKKLRITGIMTSFSDKEKTENKTLDSSFSLTFTGWHYVFLTFTKEGYYPVKQDLVADSEKGNQGFLKDGIKIVLRQVGEVAISLKRDKMLLSREPQYDKSIHKTGWVYEEKRNLKAGTHDKSNNIVYDDPAEVDIYAERAEDGDGLYLISNDENTGFTELMEAKDFTYLPEAPEDGYQPKLLIPYLPRDPSDPAQRRSAGKQFCYFKVKEDFYGKMKIEANEFESGASYRITCIYYLNPDGSRNLRSMDK